MDFLILPTSDIRNPSDKPNEGDNPAPLYKRPWDKNNQKTVSFLVNHWINLGFPPEKIIINFALYGRSWMLSSNKIIPPVPAFGSGPPGKYTSYSFMSYLEICLAIVNEGWQTYQESHQTVGTKGPYAVSPGKQNRTWVGYDDPTIAAIKSEYILSKGLGGAAVWDVSYDDFRNKCGGGHNPMLTEIRNTLFSCCC